MQMNMTRQDPGKPDLMVNDSPERNSIIRGRAVDMPEEAWGMVQRGIWKWTSSLTRRRLKRNWRLLLALAVTTILVYYVVFIAEDDVRNIILSLRMNAAFMFVSAPTDASPVDCAAVLRGEKTEILKARMADTAKHKPSASGVPYIGQTCDAFKKSHGYILHVSEEEAAFSLAFSIITYKNIHQVERLLRAVYRPSNVYCIHVDRKSDAMFEEMRRLVACFDNVFLSSRRINVKWGEFSVVEPELVCMKDLLKHPRWRYFINLTGQEFPLKTNLQLVKILKTYDGANDVAGTDTRYNENIRRFWRAGRPPHNIRPVIGSAHIVVNRNFVNYSVNDPVAKDLQEWSKHTEIPDETYFPTLNFNPQLKIPGTFKGAPRLEPFMTRYKNWDHGLLIFKDDCQGRYLREICILGPGDLPSLVTQNHLFANKFEENFQPAALDCMEEWYFNMTREEQKGKTDFDTSFYSKLDFVLNHV